MKTKLFNSFAVAAMSVLALACAKEPVGEGIEAGVSFSIEVPGSQATKAIGDGETAKKLYYQVFDKDGAAIEGLGVQNTDIAGKTATVKFQLVKDQELMSPAGASALAKVTSAFPVKTSVVASGEKTFGTPFTVTAEAAPVKSMSFVVVPAEICPAVAMLICANGRESLTVSETGPVTVIFLTA